MKKTKDFKIETEFKENKKHPFRKFLLWLFYIIIAISTTLFIITFFYWKSLVKDMILNTPSTVLDTDGNVIATIGDTKITGNVDFKDIPDNLKNAYIAIEDQRYYSHFGIDIKRTAAATLSYIKNWGNASFGGSTITQQLVKNLTARTTNSISLKIDEWIKAVQLEMFLSKEDILEAYFNIIYTGPNVYGVKKGASYYFSKDIKDLSLAECAYLAGINIAPYSYNPFIEDKDNSEKIKLRTETVLIKMKELGYITEKEYKTAYEETENGLAFNKTKEQANNGVYSYHTDAMLSEIIKDLAKAKHISNAFAENYISLSGLTIRSTQNSRNSRDY